MSNETSIQSVKFKAVIKDLIEGKKSKGKKKAVDTWWSINRDSWRAANLVVSQQQINDFLARGAKSLDHDVNYKDIEEKFKDVFGVKRRAIGERAIKSQFPNLPSSVSNPLAYEVDQNYKKDRPKVRSGERSCRSYRKGMPFPISSSRVSIGKHGFSWTIGRGQELQFDFCLKLHKNKQQLRTTLNDVVADSLKPLSVHHMMAKKNKKGEWEIFFVIHIKVDAKTQHDLDSNLCVGVDIGFVNPAVCALSSGLERAYIGNGKEILAHRTSFKEQRKRAKKNVFFCQGGHGKKRKFRHLDKIGERESRWVNNYNRIIARDVVNFAVKNRAGIIKLEFLKGFNDSHRDNFFLTRNWSYHQLQQFIIQRAKKEGVKVGYVDPYRTSQTCSLCGHFEEGQRKTQSEFVCANPECKNFGKVVNADYNASANIAGSKKIVVSEKQCEIFILKKEAKERRKSEIEKATLVDEKSEASENQNDFTFASAARP